MPYTTAADNTALFHQDWGTGPTYVLCASWALSSKMWEELMIHACDRGARCVAVDRRGHGRSDRPGHGYDLDTLADDLASIIEALDLRDVILVGASLGAAEIVRYLTRHGDQRIRQIAFVCGATPVHLHLPDNPDGITTAELDAVLEAMQNDWPGFLASIAPPYFGDGLPGCDVSPARQAATLRDAENTAVCAAIGLQRAGYEADLRSELATIDVPALLVHGDHDVSEPVELTARRTAELIPHCELHVYPGATHGLHLTSHRHQLFEDLLRFADTQTASAAGSEHNDA